jgi:hypothetical protein
MPAQVEVIVADALLGAKGIHANETEPRPEDVTNDEASAPRSPRGPYRDLVASGPSMTLPGDAALGDSTLAPSPHTLRIQGPLN